MNLTALLLTPVVMFVTGSTLRVSLGVLHPKPTGGTDKDWSDERVKDGI